LGKIENFSRCEDDAGHESTRKNREAMYAFFRKHLDNPGITADEEVKLLSKDELRVTETGQVSTSLKGETVFSLNLRDADKIQTVANRDEVLKSARDLSGYIEPETIGTPVFTGRLKRTGYVIEKYFVKGEGDYVLPYLIFKPEVQSVKAMIYLHPEGKAAEAKAEGEIEQYVKQGFIVLAPDMAGTGELGRGDLKGDAYFNGASHNLWYAAMLVGRSITGIQAGDVTRLAIVLKKYSGVENIAGFAKQGMVPVLLHSALLSGQINSLILDKPYSSFRALVSQRFYDPFFVMSSVPGALRKYDLPQLEAAFAPRSLTIIGAVDGNNSKADLEQVDKDLNVVKKAYEKAVDKLRIE
jgi:hypothetical protein